MRASNSRRALCCSMQCQFQSFSLRSAASLPGCFVHLLTRTSLSLIIGPASPVLSPALPSFPIPSCQNFRPKRNQSLAGVRARHSEVAQRKHRYGARGRWTGAMVSEGRITALRREDQFASQSTSASITQVEQLLDDSHSGTLMDKTRALMAPPRHLSLAPSAWSCFPRHACHLGRARPRA